MSAVLLFCAVLTAQAPPSLAPSPSEAATETAGKDRILLVLPFENRTGQPSLEWIREAAPALLSARYAIDLAGTRVAAAPSLTAWHDPTGARLRA